MRCLEYAHQLTHINSSIQLEQKTVSLLLLGGGCFSALFSDMNTESFVLTVAYPTFFLAAICGYGRSHSNDNTDRPTETIFGLICIYLVPFSLCRAVGGIDYFHVSGYSIITSYVITLLILIPVAALILSAALVQKSLWMYQSQREHEEHEQGLLFRNWTIQPAWSSFAFPVLLCGIFQLMFQYSPIGAGGNPAMGLNSVAAPTLLQLTSVFGEIGLVFGIGWAASLGAGLMVKRTSKLQFFIFVTTWITFQILGGRRLISGTGLMANPIQKWPLSKVANLKVTCLCYDDRVDSSRNLESMISRVNDRLTAGDDLILTSEVAIRERVTPDMFQWPMETNPGAVVAVAYFEKINNTLSNDGNGVKYYNSIELFQANTSISRYNKNRPVPILENMVVAGTQPPEPMNIVFTPIAKNQTSSSNNPQRTSVTLKVAAAICFDFDFPSVIRRANDADLMIGPSNYWGSIGQNLWSDNIYRAVENGFTLFKCSRDGISGVVDPYGRRLTYHPTLNGDTFTAQVPVQPGVSTIYSNYGGHYFGWICLLLSPILIIGAYQAQSQAMVEEDDGHDDSSISDSYLQSPLILQEEVSIGNQIDNDMVMEPNSHNKDLSER